MTVQIDAGKFEPGVPTPIERAAIPP